jgi:peroxiredoxin
MSLSVLDAACDTRIHISVLQGGFLLVIVGLNILHPLLARGTHKKLGGKVDKKSGSAMTQAEIAGGTVTSRNELPSKGYRLYDFELPSALGKKIHLSDYRGRLNLVLMFADNSSEETTKLLVELARQYGEIKREDTEVLVVIRLSLERSAELKKRLKLPYPILVDEDGHVHEAVRATGRGVPAIYITDRFGEVFGIYRTCESERLPEVSEILNWLEFVNSQCPECESPEWPA